MDKLTINKKIILGVVGFIVLFVIITVVYLLLNNSSQPNANNPGGTGGDYTPSNILVISNDGILYEAVGSANTTQIEALLQKAVLYNISISNDPSASSTYIQFNNFNVDTAKYYKSGATYTAKIDNGDISSPNKIPWNYQFTVTTNDKRKFQVLTDVNPDNETPSISVQKLD